MANRNHYRGRKRNYRRKRDSLRRWKARADLGRWVPDLVFEDYQLHRWFHAVAYEPYRMCAVLKRRVGDVTFP